MGWTPHGFYQKRGLEPEGLEVMRLKVLVPLHLSAYQVYPSLLLRQSVSPHYTLEQVEKMPASFNTVPDERPAYPDLNYGARELFLEDSFWAVGQVDPET